MYYRGIGFERAWCFSNEIVKEVAQGFNLDQLDVINLLELKAAEVVVQVGSILPHGQAMLVAQA